MRAFFERYIGLDRGPGMPPGFYLKNMSKNMQIGKMKKGLNLLKPLSVAVTPEGFKPSTF